MKRHFSSLLFLIAAMLWGFAFSAQDLLGDASAFLVGASRNIIATLFLLAVIPLLDKFTKNGRRLFAKKTLFDFNKTELLGGLVCGIILTAASAFQQIGIGDGTDGGKAAFITALYVVIVPIMGIALGRRSPINVWISVAIAVVGFYFLCIKDGFTLALSDLLVLVCAVIFALHILAIDRFSPRCDGVRMSCVQFFVAFILNLILTLIIDGGAVFAALPDILLPILYLGICSSGIAYTLQIIGQRDANPAVASLILSLESLFGVIGSALIIGTRMSLREYIGCAVVFAAVILSQIDFSTIIKKNEDKK